MTIIGIVGLIGLLAVVLGAIWKGFYEAAAHQRRVIRDHAVDMEAERAERDICARWSL